MPTTKDMTEAEKQSEVRRLKTVWMNKQLAARLPGADYVQPGTKSYQPREDNVYPAAPVADKK